MSELSDNNTPRRLEDVFRAGMNQAEVAPSDQLWDRIEKELHVKEAGYYKERMLWFQRLAAACVVLLLIAGGYLIRDLQEKPAAPVAVQEPVKTKNKQRNEPVLAAQTNSNTSGQRVNDAGAAPLDLGASASVAKAEASEKKVNPRPSFSATEEVARDGNYRADSFSSGRSRVASAKAGRRSSGLKGQGREPETIAGEVIQTAVPAVAMRLVPLSGTRSWPELGGVDPVPSLLPVPTLPEVALAVAAPEEKNSTKHSRWQLAGKYGSQYFNQNVSLASNRASHVSAYPGQASFNNAPALSANPQGFEAAFREFDQNTRAGYSFNSGISATFQINKHLQLESGLDYTQNVALTSTSYIFNNSQWAAARFNKESTSSRMYDASLNNVITTGLPATAFLAAMSGEAELRQSAVSRTQTFNTQYRYRILGVPVKLNYQLGQRRSAYFASVGLLSGVLMQADVLSDSPRVPNLEYAPAAEPSPFRKWQFAALAGAGKTFRVTEGLQLKAGLEASRYLTHLTSHADYQDGKQGKPFSIGVVLGSSYTIGK